MGVTSIGSGSSSITPPAVDTAPDAAAIDEVGDIEGADVAAPADPSTGTDATTSGFDDAKQALLALGTGLDQLSGSTTSPELAALANAAKSLVNGGLSLPPLQDGGVDTAASLGAGPGPRPPAADFAAQAKTAGAKTPDDVEAKAIELGKAALEKDFGVHVKDGDRSWSAEDLSRAYESLSKLPAADRAKLSGLDLVRQRNAPPESQNEAKFGTVAGEYSPNVTTKDGARVKNGSISMYDAAFPPGNSDDARKTSMQVFTHEAGHAVEGRDRDDALAAYNQSVDVNNAKVDVLNATVDPNNDAWKDVNSSSKALGKQTPSKELNAFITANNGMITALTAVQNATTPAALTKAQADLATAKGKRDAAYAKLSPDDKSAADDCKSATTTLESTATAYAKAKIDNLATEKDMKAKQATLGTLGTAPSYQSSKELEAFTKARGKESPVSNYGASKAPEGYAEAYALYQRDPSYMKEHFPKQYAFFHAKHLSANDT